MNRLFTLLVVAVGLVAIIVMEIVDAPSGDVSRSPSRATSATSASLPLAVSHTSDWVAAILARPLFSPDRRPSTDATVVASGRSGLPRLTGIMVSPVGRSAIFAADASKPVVVQEGGHVGAYTIKSIDLAQVRLIGPDGAQVVRPSFEQGAGNTADGQTHGRAALPR